METSMRRRALILGALAALGLGLGFTWEMSIDPAGQAARKPALPTQSEPELYFPEQQVDLGLITEPRKHEFNFENRGLRTVRIQRIYSSCSCTLTQPDKQEYRPGEAGKLAVSVAPQLKPGNHAYE